MKNVQRLVLIIATIFLMFTGCTADIVGQKMADQIKEQIESSADSLPSQVTPTNSTGQNDGASLPITFLHSHAGDGALHVSVDQARIIRNLDELPSPEGFLEDFSYAYGGAIENPTLYEYPNIFRADGSMQDGIYMVLLDVTVANPDGATSRYQAANGNWVNHYEDPYLFQAQPTCQLVNQAGSTNREIRASYFSEKSDTWKNPDAFLLREGEEKNFQIGFLIGYETVIENNELKVAPVLPENLLLWALLPELLPTTWELHLR